ncbi:hypothetical protein EWM64_g6372 [Hericium alpestre]|uniref:AB hydrolase-1 domain-containing protein n=1 Tax=Hericium alpestre TaxID=135208 RepID=A0A4Y9ZVV1_9AGAM|nr:hypothetical protein EWM64_g6372 [Hericium alpestre]
MRSGLFGRMLPHAAANGLRLVLLNRPEYTHSTLLSDDELAMICGAETSFAAGRGFLRRRSIEIALFMAWFVQAEPIPPISDKDQGGLILVGWSSGWAHIAPLLAYADEVPADVVQALTPYFRGLCAFDPPCVATGLPLKGIAQSWYRPVSDSSLTLAEFCGYFPKWVSSYYSHPGFHSRDYDGMSETSIIDPPADKRPTTECMSLADQAATLCQGAIDRLERPLFAMPAKIFLDVTQRLFDGSKEKANVWPNCKIYVVSCEETGWEALQGCWQLEDLYLQKRESGEFGRELITSAMPGCNHFPHWDKPEFTCEFFSRCFGKAQETFHRDARF